MVYGFKLHSIYRKSKTCEGSVLAIKVSIASFLICEILTLAVATFMLQYTAICVAGILSWSNMSNKPSIDSLIIGGISMAKTFDKRTNTSPIIKYFVYLDKYFVKDKSDLK